MVKMMLISKLNAPLNLFLHGLYLCLVLLLFCNCGKYDNMVGVFLVESVLRSMASFAF